MTVKYDLPKLQYALDVRPTTVVPRVLRQDQSDRY